MDDADDDNEVVRTRSGELKTLLDVSSARECALAWDRHPPAAVGDLSPHGGDEDYFLLAAYEDLLPWPIAYTANSAVTVRIVDDDSNETIGYCIIGAHS